MSYYNWFHKFFDDIHFNESSEKIVKDVINLLEYRSSEYLNQNDNYSDLWIDPNEDILNSKPQIIQQVKEELFDFLKLLIDTKSRKILQIGLGHYGSTHFCLSLICDTVVTIEFNKNFICEYTSRELLYNQNKEHFIYGDSMSPNTINLVQNYGLFDALFIDGNHSYEYVKNDYITYSNFVRTGGIIAFHDAMLEGERYGTPKVLREIKNEIKYINKSKEVGIAYFIKK